MIPGVTGSIPVCRPKIQGKPADSSAGFSVYGSENGFGLAGVAVRFLEFLLLNMLAGFESLSE